MGSTLETIDDLLLLGSHSHDGGRNIDSMSQNKRACRSGARRAKHRDPHWRRLMICCCWAHTLTEAACLLHQVFAMDGKILKTPYVLTLPEMHLFHDLK